MFFKGMIVGHMRFFDRGHLRFLDALDANIRTQLLWVEVVESDSIPHLFVPLSQHERIQVFSFMGIRHLLYLDEAGFTDFYQQQQYRTTLESQFAKVYFPGRQLPLAEPRVSNDSEEALLEWKRLLGSPDDFVANMGYYYPLHGQVVSGNQIGRTLGFPTANLAPDDPHKVVPPQGVYAGFARLEKRWIGCMINIGIRPTLNLDTVTIEAHLLDFNETIYDSMLSLHFVKRIRNELRFSSLDTLKTQLENDKNQTRKLVRQVVLPNPSAYLILAE